MIRILVRNRINMEQEMVLFGFGKCRSCVIIFHFAVSKLTSAMYSTPAVTVSVPVHIRQSLEWEIMVGDDHEDALGKSLGCRSLLHLPRKVQ